ncbi:MAG: hypothetical protein K2K57_05130 [Oscillospiraceae bacterium]|nr:hypothetical protein [Oscillospiraceae bacterium]
MLKKILSPESCAKCRVCCIFDKYDVWETPVISKELREKISEVSPGLKFASKGNAFIFNMEECWDEKEELFTCPALDPQKGCTLGDLKPFDCKIWPYRIMRLGNDLVISIASICPEMYSKPLSELTGMLEGGLAEEIFREAALHPEMIKPYEQGYPILKVKEGENK